MIKRGSKVRVVKMDTAGGMDWQAKQLEGKIFTVRFIDSAGQIQLEETGIALIPGVDEYRDCEVTLLEKGLVPFSFSANCLIFTPINQWRHEQDLQTHRSYLLNHRGTLCRPHDNADIPSTNPVQRMGLEKRSQ